MTTLQAKSRWYVYELIDPRDQAVFYVGKGTGKRVDAHEAEAASQSQVCSRKLNRIRDIWQSGASVQKRKVAFFWDEQAAYDHETEVIAGYGLAALTNVLPGGQKAWANRLHELAERKERKVSQNRIEAILSDYSSPLFARFADWFRFGGHKGAKILVEGGPRWNAAVTTAFYNAGLPGLFREINANPSWREKFVSAMKCHKVELQYGCP